MTYYYLCSMCYDRSASRRMWGHCQQHVAVMWPPLWPVSWDSRQTWPCWPLSLISCCSCTHPPPASSTILPLHFIYIQCGVSTCYMMFLCISFCYVSVLDCGCVLLDLNFSKFSTFSLYFSTSYIQHTKSSKKDTSASTSAYSILQ